MSTHPRTSALDADLNPGAGRVRLRPSSVRHQTLFTALSRARICPAPRAKPRPSRYRIDPSSSAPPRYAAMWSRHLDNQLTSGPRPLCEGPPAFCTPPGIPACMGLNAVRMVSQARPSISGPVLYRRAPVIWRRAHYLAVGLTCPVSVGLGGKAGHGPSFTWKASSAIAREDFSSTYIGIIKPPARQSQEYVGTRAQENQLFPVAASGVDFGNAQCPNCHSDAARSETQTRAGCENGGLKAENPGPWQERERDQDFL